MSKSEARQSLKDKRRIVIKIGSALLAESGNVLSQRIADYCRQIAQLMGEGYEFLIVTSGAVAAGMGRLGLDARPTKVNELQAIAAIGQMKLMQVYEEEISRLDLISSMVLLTHDDFSDRRRYLNARSTLTRLMKLGAVPLINENDTVATDEIKFGDNDTLCALVTNLVDADLQIILTDVDGLMDKDPNIFEDAERVVEASADDQSLELLSSDRTSSLGRGGMLSKVKAARLASRSGADTAIASGRVKNILIRLLEREDLGTYLFSESKSLKSRKRWIADQLKPTGKIVIDSGAAMAISGGGVSLLAVGVVKVSGEFDRGDLVECCDEEGTSIAQGLVNYSSSDIEQLKGFNSENYSSRVKHVYEDELVHCDNLVIV